MSNAPVETMEPDPAATSLPNDTTVNTEVVDSSAPTDIAAETAATEANGSIKAEVEPKVEVKEEIKEEAAPDKEASAAVKGEKDEKKYDPSKPRFYDNGVLKTTAQQDDFSQNNSKYDPSVLSASNDHEQIRAQVWTYSPHAPAHYG